MSNAVLVTYASKYGSTQEVAEAIAAELRERGLTVEVKPVKQAGNVGGYAAVVLGAPLYIGALLKDAANFLKQNAQALAGRPVAVFGLGPIHVDEQERVESLEQMKKELAKFPWLTPVAVEMFGGKYDPAKLRFPDSLLLKMPTPLKDAPACDARNWDAIRAWAGEVAGKLAVAA